MPESRDEARKRKLAQKPTKSPFTAADEQAARQKKRTPSAPPAPTPAETRNTVFRDYRGTRGAIRDAEGVSNPEDPKHKQTLRDGMKKF